MARYVGKSLQVDASQLEHVVHNIVHAKQRIDDATLRKMQNATNLVYRIARQKRPMISAKQAKAEGRTHRVSDPNAELGVPVAAINGGALQNSIKKTVVQRGGKTRGEIWTSLNYAKYVEYGTSKMQARPFMRPALAHAKDAVKALFTKKEK